MNHGLGSSSAPTISAATAAAARRESWTHFTPSSIFATSDSEARSSFTIEGGFARVNPVPTTSHPCLWNAFTTCLPSRPVAPVMRAVFAIVVQLSGELGGSRSQRVSCRA